MSGASWTKMAEQDLVEVGDTAIIRRLMQIADETLRLPSRDHSPDEGWVAGREGSLAWRRGVPLSQNADDSDGAADYYIIYHEHQLIKSTAWPAVMCRSLLCAYCMSRLSSHSGRITAMPPSASLSVSRSPTSSALSSRSASRPSVIPSRSR